MLVEFNAIRDFVDRHSRDEVIEMVISLMPDNQQSRIKDFFGRFPHEDSAVRNTLKLILYLSEVKKIKNIDDKWIDISLKFGIFTNLFKQLTKEEYSTLYTDPVCSMLLSSEIFQSSIYQSSKTKFHKATIDAEETDSICKVGTNQLAKINEKKLVVAPQVYNCTVALVKITNNEGRDDTFLLHLNPNRIYAPVDQASQDGYCIWLDHVIKDAGREKIPDSIQAYYNALKGLTQNEKVEVKLFSGSVSHDDQTEIEGLKKLLANKNIDCKINVIRIPSGQTSYNLSYNIREDSILIWRGEEKIKDKFIEITSVFHKDQLEENFDTSFHNRFIDYYRSLLTTGVAYDDAAKQAIQKYIDIREEWIAKTKNKIPLRGSLSHKLFFNPKKTESNLSYARKIRDSMQIEDSDLSNISNGQLKALLETIRKDKKEYDEFALALNKKYGKGKAPTAFLK